MPSAFLTRYLKANNDSPYFVAIPKNPISHIHKIEPGPPQATAVPTPIILPVPIVEAKAVAKAPKGEMLPASLSSLDSINLIAIGIFR